MLHAFIFWGSFVYFPFLLIAFWLYKASGRLVKSLVVVLVILTSVLAYARFIEPRLLVSHHETIILPGATKDSPTIKIALFGDTHYGRFPNAMPLSKIVKRINSEGVDATFIAGDFTYHTKPTDIPSELAPLKHANAPVIAVLGNHDVGVPGPNLTNPLLKSLAEANVTLVHNRSIEVELNDQTITIGGMSDLWQKSMHFDFANAYSGDETILLLTHNPDMAAYIPNSLNYDLLLAGHTHGGQIRIPFMFQKAIPTTWPFDKELHNFPAPGGDRLVYVTSGTGMVGLPMRFAMPPRVDILTLHIADKKIPPDN